MENYLMAKEIKTKYKIHVATLYRWERQGLLHPLRTGGGHRRYSESELLTIMGAGTQDGGWTYAGSGRRTNLIGEAAALLAVGGGRGLYVGL